MTEPLAIELVCKEVVELVTDYLSDKLTAEDRHRFEHHLSTCPPCTAYLAQVRTTIDMAAELATANPPPAALPEQLGEIFRRWHQERER